jgi:hypothetical protein
VVEDTPPDVVTLSLSKGELVEAWGLLPTRDQWW